MRLVKENGVELLMYDSIEDLPMWRFKEYNKALMLDVGLGSDAQSISDHINRWKSLTKYGQTDHAMQELSNLQQNLMYVISGVDLKMNSFCALVKEVDGEPFDYLSPDRIEWLTKRLSYKGFTYGKMKHLLSEVKKNLISSLTNFFPRRNRQRKRDSTS